MRMSDTQRLLVTRPQPLGDITKLLRELNVDGMLLGGILLICGAGLVVQYSAVGESDRALVSQMIRLGVGFIAMLIVAQMPPDFLRRWTPAGYIAGIALLVLVLVTGEVGKGAQRWLDIGIRFQPSEVMKLAVPMMTAWYLHDRPMPPRASAILIIGVIIAAPVILIAKQPDLGTSLLVAASGIIVIVLAGLSFRLITALFALSLPGALVFWQYFMQDYQKQPCSTRTATRWAPATTLSSRRLRSALAACSARAGRTARRPSSSSCRSAAPISSSPCSARNSACSVCSYYSPYTCLL